MESFSIKRCKDFARRQLKGRWATPVLVLLVTTVMICVLYPWDYYVKLAGTVIKDFDSSFSTPVLDTGSYQFWIMYARSLFAALFILLVSPILELAADMVFMQLFRTKEKVGFKYYMSNFQYFWKAFAAAMWRFLWIYLWELVAVAPGFIISVIILIITGVQGLLNPDNLFVFILILSVCYALIFIPAIIVSLVKNYAYSQQMFIIAENPKVGPVDAMNYSKKITKGYKGKLFALDLSFIGWYILGLVTLGISYLWIDSWRTMSKVNAYKILKKNYFESISADKSVSAENEKSALPEETKKISETTESSSGQE